MTKSKQARQRAAARPDKEKTRKISVPYGAHVIIVKEGEGITDEAIKHFEPLLEPIIYERVKKEIDQWLEKQKLAQQVAISPDEAAQKVMGYLRGLPYGVQTKVIGHILQRLKVDREQHLASLEKQEQDLTNSRRNAERHLSEFDNVLSGNFTIL